MQTKGFGRAVRGWLVLALSVVMLGSLQTGARVAAQSSAQAETAETHYQEGLTLYWTLEMPDALQAFKRALQADPAMVEALAFRGATYRALGAYTFANRDFEQALALDENSALTYSMRARLRYEQRDFNGAEADMERALSLDSGDAYVLYNQGRIAEFGGNFEDALDIFNATLENVTTEPPGFSAAIYQSRGNILLLQADYAGAIADFDSSLEIDPDDYLTLARRGLTHFYQGDFEAALTDINRALELEDRDAFVYLYRAFVYEELDDPETALEDYARAQALDPELPTIYLGQGYNLLQLGRYEEALNAYQTYEILVGEENVPEGIREVITALEACVPAGTCE